MFKTAIVLVLVAVLLGCNSSSDWQTTDITGLLPDLGFSLQNPAGEKITEEALSGQAVLLFFGFTNCPDICPTTLARLASVVRTLPQAQREQVTIAFVSVDPARDTPERMAAYAQAFGDRVLALRTDNESQLKALTRRYRVTYGYGEPTAAGQYEVSHSAGVFIFDPQGRARLLARDTDSVEAIAADLQGLLSAATAQTRPQR